MYMICGTGGLPQAGQYRQNELWPADPGTAKVRAAASTGKLGYLVCLSKLNGNNSKDRRAVATWNFFQFKTLTHSLPHDRTANGHSAVLKLHNSAALKLREV